MVGKVRQQQQKINIEHPRQRFSPNRAIMEKIDSSTKKKQADAVNKNRAKIEKLMLEVGDVGSIRVQGNTYAATAVQPLIILGYQ